MNTFKKGQFCVLPLKGIKREGKNSYFVVIANGKEYSIRMFDFQVRHESLIQRKELACRVKDVHDDNIVFVQNFAEMFAETYLAEQSYPFIVTKEAFNDDTEFRYYDVRDYNNVPFRLKCKKDVTLVPHQKIRCRVKRPARNRMLLVLEDTRRETTKHFLTVDEVLQRSGLAQLCQRYFRIAFATYTGFQVARTQYANNTSEWLITALLSVSTPDKWSNMSLQNKLRTLKWYRRMCLFVIEDSGYLLQFSEDDIETYQEWISDCIGKVETYSLCFSLIKDGRDGEETDNILRKIRNSGYIYRPHHRMRELITLFSLKPQMLEEKIDSILTLLAECAKDWKQKSFNDAFAGFLRYYVEINHSKVSREATMDNDESRLNLARIIRSLCFLLLMTDADERKDDRTLWRSMLYHYLSYVKTTMSKQLVEKAMLTLLQEEDERLEFAWTNDFRHIDFLAYQLGHITEHGKTFPTKTFESQNVRFTISDSGVVLSRSVAGNKEKDVMVKKLIDWYDLKIYLDQPSHYSISRQTKNLRAWKTYWTNVENGLFEARKVFSKPVRKLSRPEVGSVTKVRILWRDESRLTRWWCRIEDGIYEGEGWIDTYQKGGAIGMFHFDPMLDADSFYLEGKPMLIPARINSVGSPSDERTVYFFDSIPYIDDFIRESVNFGEESDCKIIFTDTSKQIHCGITEYGYGIFLPFQSEYKNVSVGNTVHVRVTDAQRPNSIQGEIISEEGISVDIKEACSSLLRDLVGDDLYEESDEELEQEAMQTSEDILEPEFVDHIVSILDHKAAIETDNVRSYAFLAIAHILTRMTGDESILDYLAQRMHLLTILEDYGNNGKINDAELQNLWQKNEDMLNRFPLLQQRMSEIRIVNCLGQTENNGFLWNMATENDETTLLGKLSRLMLSYNMAEGFGLHEHQYGIITKIKSLLNVNVELPAIYSFGEEDQQTEFKTSIVFPPNNNMREDIKQQTFNIMKVICGMVNSYGGVLYLGVRDKVGTAVGLESDLEYFDGSTDKFDNYVRNQIRKSLGDSVNASVIVTHPDAGKHYVYAIHVPPAKTPVMLKLDNRYYLREGASTYEIDLMQLQEIMADRNFNAYGNAPTEFETIEIPDAEVNVEEKVEEKTPELSITPTQSVGDEIATSKLRSNIVDNWVDGYGYDTQCFLRIQSVGNWCVLDDVPWSDGILTLALHDEDESLVIVYEDGNINRVPLSQLVDKTREKTFKMYDKKPLFVCPVRSDDALLTAYVDDKGKQYLRLDDVQNIEEGKMQSLGQKLTVVEFDKLFFCEVIKKEFHEDLKRMHNMKHTTLGCQALTSYGAREQEAMRKIGIEL